jgi:hypothetical protein
MAQCFNKPITPSTTSAARIPLRITVTVLDCNSSSRTGVLLAGNDATFIKRAAVTRDEKPGIVF